MNMQGRKTLKSERGFATIMFLIVLPLIMVFLIASLDHSRSVFGTDLDMQQALNDACRSATMMVDPLSQAYNYPIIDPDKAHQAFTAILASNLRLNNDLSPKENSPVKDLEYVFFVINGGKPHDSLINVPDKVVYSSDNPLGEVLDDSAFPEIYVPWMDTAIILAAGHRELGAIAPSDALNLDINNPEDAEAIQQIISTSKTIQLEDSSCVGVVKAELKPIIGQQESTGVRWSAARIIRGDPVEPEGGFFQ